jgi:hypothetical protein
MIHIKRPPVSLSVKNVKPLRLKYCNTCKHFNEGMCNKFISVNLVDGTEASVSASDARNDLSMCGVGAAHHIAKLEQKR